jgi:hypothetical protein
MGCRILTRSVCLRKCAGNIRRITIARFERIKAVRFFVQISMAEDQPSAISMEFNPMVDTNHDLPEGGEDRRSFLKACGKFAAVTPPAVSILLSTSLNSDAIARSGGSYGGGHGKSRRGRKHHSHRPSRGRRRR